MTKHYFAVDGNYGNASGIVTVETDDWKREDWEAIDEASDDERAWVAERIARKHGARRWQVWYRDYESGERLPLGYAPLFHSKAEAEDYLNDHDSWEFSVWVEGADFCHECWEAVGNSVTEQVNGYTTCHSCLTRPQGE